jgi:lipopolysaccharide/colanic/teichoic acid biosynthesis glycosyltransferase
MDIRLVIKRIFDVVMCAVIMVVSGLCRHCCIGEVIITRPSVFRSRSSGQGWQTFSYV